MSCNALCDSINVISLEEIHAYVWDGKCDKSENHANKETRR